MIWKDGADSFNIVQAGEDFSSCFLWCDGSSVGSLATRGHACWTGAISVDVPDRKVIVYDHWWIIYVLVQLLCIEIVIVIIGCLKVSEDPKRVCSQPSSAWRFDCRGLHCQGVSHFLLNVFKADWLSRAIWWWWRTWPGDVGLHTNCPSHRTDAKGTWSFSKRAWQCSLVCAE